MFVVAFMPDLSGLDAATAQRMVENAGLYLELDYAYSQTREGYVCDQTPKANTEVARGETVQAVISRGSSMLTVQRLTGMTQEEAEESLIAQGFVVSSVQVVPSEMMRGTVIAQQPASGESVQIGTAFDLTVSGGRVVVPEEEAVERIGSVGLTCGEITYQTVETARQDGMVLSQSLEKFTQVLPGSVVDMTVGKYDKRKYTADVTVNVEVPEAGVTVRVTLVEEDGSEYDMYAATHTEPGELSLKVTLRGETSGVRTWRLYLDGNFRSEATAVLQ